MVEKYQHIHQQKHTSQSLVEQYLLIWIFDSKMDYTPWKLICPLKRGSFQKESSLPTSNYYFSGESCFRLLFKNGTCTSRIFQNPPTTLGLEVFRSFKWRPSQELFGWFKEGIQDQFGGVWENLGGGFKHGSFYADPWGNDANSLILFKWIETIRKTRCPWVMMGWKKSQSKGYEILYTVDFVRTQGRIVSRTGS